MTDAKGDRTKAPHEQADPDLFLHVERPQRRSGVFLRGAKAHMTGGCNSHWLCVLPTMSLREADRDYAVVAMVPAATPRASRTSTAGRLRHPGARARRRSTRATRELRRPGGARRTSTTCSCPTSTCSGRRDGVRAARSSSASPPITARSYVCKTGLGDVITGAAAEVAEQQRRRDRLARQGQARRDGPPQRDDLRRSIASAYQARADRLGHLDERRHARQRLQAQRHPLPVRDRAPGAGPRRGTRRDDALRGRPRSEEVGPLLERMLAGRAGVPTEDRMRICG